VKAEGERLVVNEIALIAMEEALGSLFAKSALEWFNKCRQLVPVAKVSAKS